MTSVNFIIPCRDKAAHVGRCLKSVLDQTVDDFSVVISDQASEDGSLDVILDVLRGYNGLKDVRLLNCPETNYRGMAGLNAHLNWIHDQIECDLVIMCSADDWNHPERVEKTRAAYEMFHPSYIGTRVNVMLPDGTYKGETGFPDRASRWIAPAECIKYMIGSSASSAWSYDLFRKYGPLDGIEAQDLVLPLMGLLERGLYYIDEPLHHYTMYNDINNTGLEGQVRAAENDLHARQLLEVNAFHNAHHWMNIWRRLQAGGMMERLSSDAKQELVNRVIDIAGHWVWAREVLTLWRVPPLGMRI